MNRKDEIIKILCEDTMPIYSRGDIIGIQDINTTLADIVDKILALDDWRKVEDELPEEVGKYLCYRPNSKSKESAIREQYFVVGREKEYNKGFGPSEYNQLAYVKITHWKPLPEPPRKE